MPGLSHSYLYRRTASDFDFVSKDLRKNSLNKTNTQRPVTDHLCKSLLLWFRDAGLRLGLRFEWLLGFPVYHLQVGKWFSCLLSDFYSVSQSRCQQYLGLQTFQFTFPGQPLPSLFMPCDLEKTSVGAWREELNVEAQKAAGALCSDTQANRAAAWAERESVLRGTCWSTASTLLQCTQVVKTPGFQKLLAVTNTSTVQLSRGITGKFGNCWCPSFKNLWKPCIK